MTSIAPDIPENRLIRSALRRMLAVPGLRRDFSARLAHLDGRLEGVQVLPPGAALPTWRLTRLNARYAAALRLAEIVLRNQSAEPGPGGVSVAAFVVSMAKVFEDFVTVALREALAPHPGHTEAQYPGHLDEQRKIAILPDVVHVVAHQPVAVFDAKYKLEDASSGYPNADVYQMLAYCTALQLPRGWLVYAQGNAPPGVRRVRHTSVDIIQYPLDLAASPADLLRQVDMLARTALGLTREEPSTVTGLRSSTPAWLMTSLLSSSWSLPGRSLTTHGLGIEERHRLPGGDVVADPDRPGADLLARAVVPGHGDGVDLALGDRDFGLHGHVRRLRIGSAVELVTSCSGIRRFDFPHRSGCRTGPGRST